LLYLMQDVVFLKIPIVWFTAVLIQCSSKLWKLYVISYEVHNMFNCVQMKFKMCSTVVAHANQR
jgi:hypothetical protein